MGICQSKTEDPTKPKPVTEPIPSEPVLLEVETSNKTKEMGIKDNIPVPVDVTIKALK